VVALSLWFFLFDGSVTLLRRIAGGKESGSSQDALLPAACLSGLSHDAVVLRIMGFALQLHSSHHLRQDRSSPTSVARFVPCRPWGMLLIVYTCNGASTKPHDTCTFSSISMKTLYRPFSL